MIEFASKIVLALYRIGTKIDANLNNKIENKRLMIYLCFEIREYFDVSLASIELASIERARY